MTYKKYIYDFDFGLSWLVREVMDNLVALQEMSARATDLENSTPFRYTHESVLLMKLYRARLVERIVKPFYDDLLVTIKAIEEEINKEKQN